MRQIEDDALVGENEIFFKNEQNFFANLEETEVNNLKARQQKELRALKTMQELKVQELVKQSGQKKFQREQVRDSFILTVPTATRAQGAVRQDPQPRDCVPQD
jgi:hypothetical protein